MEDGWVGRIGRPAVLFAGGGAIIGLIRGVRTGRPLTMAFGMALNGAEVAVSFFGAKEGMMAVRQKDDWQNYSLGGFASGGLMATMYAHKRYAIPGSIVGGAIGCAGYFLHQEWIDYKIRLYLAQHYPETEAIHEKEESPPEQVAWPEWLPFRVLTDEEYTSIVEEREQVDGKGR